MDLLFGLFTGCTSACKGLFLNGSCIVVLSVGMQAYWMCLLLWVHFVVGCNCACYKLVSLLQGAAHPSDSHVGSRISRVSLHDNPCPRRPCKVEDGGWL